MGVELMSAREATKQAKSWRGRALSLAAKHEHMLGSAIRTAEVGTGALTLGLIQGNRKPGDEYAPFGMPLDLFSGLTLHGLALFGVGGKYSEHLSNFGDAGVGSYLYLVGRGLGEDWRKKRESRGGTTGGGGADASFADRLAEIAEAA